ncbi:hypothetical protein Gotur_014320 [Gossypium turneri]
MATTMALSTRIEELEGELALCRVDVGKGVSSAALSSEDAPKSKEFMGTRSTYDVDNFLWRMENYFRAKDIVDDAIKVNTGSMFLTDIALLWWRDRTTDKRQSEIGTWQEFQCELKEQFYQEFIEEEARTKLQGIKQRGIVGEYVREFKEVMLQVSDVTDKEALLAFQNGLKPWVRHEVEQRGVQKLSEAMTVVESVVKLGLEKNKLGSSKSEERANNSGNEKPRVGKKKPKRKRDKLKCFLYDGPHILKKCLKKSVLSNKEKPMGKALVAKVSEEVCHRGNDGADKESKKLGSRKGKLRNCPKQAEVKGKATSKLGELSKGLPPKEEVSLSSDLEGKVAMKIVKLGPIRLKLSEASELAESLTRLPPMGEMGGALDFKEKEVMHVGQGPFEVLEQRGRETMGKAKPSVVNQEDSVRVKTVRVKKRCKSRQKSQRKGKAKASRRDRGESSRCHSKVATRALREWVEENVTGHSSKPVTIAPNASNRGLVFRWGSFSPQELARFKELLEKPVRLKLGWPDNEDMAT